MGYEDSQRSSKGDGCVFVGTFDGSDKALGEANFIQIESCDFVARP